MLISFRSAHALATSQVLALAFLFFCFALAGPVNRTPLWWGLACALLSTSTVAALLLSRSPLKPWRVRRADLERFLR